MVPFSVLHSPVSKYKLTSEGRHSLRLARLAIGRARSSSSSEAWRRHPQPLPDFCFPDPGHDHISSAAVFGEGVFSLSSLLACGPAAANRPHGQAASNSQHQPASSLLVNLTAALARCCTSNHNLQATGQGHGHRPSPHRPIAHLAKPQQGPPPPPSPERSTNVRATAAVSRRRKDGSRRAGTRAQRHNTNRSIVGRPVPLWSWTGYCLVSHEGCCSAVVASQTSSAWRWHRILESSNNPTIDISDQVPPRQERRSLQPLPRSPDCRRDSMGTPLVRSSHQRKPRMTAHTSLPLPPPPPSSLSPRLCPLAPHVLLPLMPLSFLAGPQKDSLFNTQFNAIAVRSPLVPLSSLQHNQSPRRHM